MTDWKSNNYKSYACQDDKDVRKNAMNSTVLNKWIWLDKLHNKTKYIAGRLSLISILSVDISIF